MHRLFCLVIFGLIFLSGCVNSGYQPTYIISREPPSEPEGLR